MIILYVVHSYFRMTFDYIFAFLVGGWYMNDNEDRPLFILRLGVMDVKGIIKSVRN